MRNRDWILQFGGAYTSVYIDDINVDKHTSWGEAPLHSGVRQLVRTAERLLRRGIGAPHMAESVALCQPGCCAAVEAARWPLCLLTWPAGDVAIHLRNLQRLTLAETLTLDVG